MPGVAGRQAASIAEARARFEAEDSLSELASLVEAAGATHEPQLKEMVTIAQAAEEAGYSADHLREMVRTGALRHLRPKGERGRVLVKRENMVLSEQR